MAPNNSSKPSNLIRNGTASMRLKRRLRRRSLLCKPTIKRMVRKEAKKQFQLFLHALNSSLAGLESTSRSLPNQAEPSATRRLRLCFATKLPDKLFTASTLHAIGDGTKENAHVRVVLLDENDEVVKEGPLSSLKVELFVACGNSKADESQTQLVLAREERGVLLVGCRVKTMENGVLDFSDLKFVDNSSWVPSKMFRLVAKVAENEQVPSTVEIRQGKSGSFRVKDQRGKSNDKHPIPSWNDKVRHLEKIGEKCSAMLEKAGICTVKGFLQQYYKDQSFLRRVLGVKDGVWETIVQHATKCTPNNTEHFRYDSEEEGVELLFDCFYKLVGISFDRQNHRPLETLTEYEKCFVEQIRRRAFKDEGKLVQINSSAGWPSANINTWNKEVLLSRCPSFPQSPLFGDEDHIILQHDQEEEPATQNVVAMEGIIPCLDQEEEPATQNVVAMERIGLLTRSDTLLYDSFIMDNENHPLSLADFTISEDYVFQEHGSICSGPVGREGGRVWSRARVAVNRYVVVFMAFKGNRPRMEKAGF